MTVLGASTVIRQSPQGGSHGAVFLVDIEQGRLAHVLDWKAPGVDWAAPGGGRGLRGMAFDGQRVFIAAADALFEFTPGLELQATYRSPYLANGHDVVCFERRLYMASTGYDSILGFDLEKNRFDWGLRVHEGERGMNGVPFDPYSSLGPPPGNHLGLNSLWCDARGMFISGAGTLGLLHFDVRTIERLVSLPRGVQNARPWRDGVLFNDTEANVARFITPDSNRVFQVPRYPPEQLDLSAAGDQQRSRQGFARGLCVVDESTFAVGSSPATITLHNLDTMKTTRSINFSSDPCHTIHSLAVWPYKVSFG